MFAGSGSLENIFFGKNFKTEKVTSMYNMFYGCSSISEFDLSNFETSSVTNMAGMFYKCAGVTELKLNNFDTTNVKKMDQMFGYCTKLENLDISNFDSSALLEENIFLFLGLKENGTIIFDPSKFDRNLLALSNLNWEEKIPEDE